MRVIRGAITADNTRESILDATRQMLEEIIKLNELQTEQVISMTFTCTRDLTKAYPAVAARELGFTDAGLMCMQELYVEGGLEKCIRVIVSIDSEKAQKDMCHVYLSGAENLRPDLKKQ